VIEDPVERMRATMGRRPYAVEPAPGEDVRDSSTIGPQAHPPAERVRAEPMPVTPVERPGEFDSRELTVAAADGITEVDDYQLGFTATMALVDNITNRWCWVDGSGTWAPPGTVNYPLYLRGTRRARASLRDDRQPPAVTVAARIAGQVCIVRYFEKPTISGSPIKLVQPL